MADLCSQQYLSILQINGVDEFETDVVSVLVSSICMERELMDKVKMKKIREQVKQNAERMRKAGWEPLSCDNYKIDHFLKSGADRLITKDGRILCRNCVLEEIP